MKKIILKFAALVALVPMFTMVAHADLMGDSVGIEVSGSGGGTSGVNTVTVGAGEEGNLFGSQFFDFGALSFAIRSTSDFGGYFSGNPADSVSLALTSLDFGSALSAVSFTTNLTGVALSFGSDWATFTWNEQAITTGTYLSATFTPVPEPASLALLGLGLAGIGFARRKRA